MNIICESTYQAFGQRTATDALALLAHAPQPLICPTAGSTPTAVYSALVQTVQQEGIDYSGWRFVALDEWAGMDGRHAGSCRHFLNTTLFEPLQIDPSAICFFDGTAPDLHRECQRVETFIAQQGGIFLALLGLGLNGHIGMNEPGTPAAARTHVAQLFAQTQTVGQKYFSAAQNLSAGVTLGLGTLLDATHLFLLANGAGKAGIVKEVVDAMPTDRLPATHLKSHGNASMYLDAEAARLL